MNNQFEYNDYARIKVKKYGDKYELSWITFAGIFLEKWELIDLKNKIEELLDIRATGDGNSESCFGSIWEDLK